MDWYNRFSSNVTLMEALVYSFDYDINREQAAYIIATYNFNSDTKGKKINAIKALREVAEPLVADTPETMNLRACKYVMDMYEIRVSF